MSVVFIIDDDRFIRLLLNRVLSNLGHVVHEYEDGKRAIADSKKIQPRLAITDLRMPQMDGLEVTRKLKKGLPDCKIIAITLPDPESKMDLLQSSKEFGADAVMAKPFKVNDVISKVNELLAVA